VASSQSRAQELTHPKAQEDDSTDRGIVV